MVVVRKIFYGMIILNGFLEFVVFVVIEVIVDRDGNICLF